MVFHRTDSLFFPDSSSFAARFVLFFLLLSATGVHILVHNYSTRISLLGRQFRKPRDRSVDPNFNRFELWFVSLPASLRVLCPHLREATGVVYET